LTRDRDSRLLADVVAEVKHVELLDPDVRALMFGPPYDKGRWGIFARDVSSGEIVAQYASNDLFMTGSTAKIFSVTAALEQLGVDRVFETHVVQYQNNLILVASGDLTLGGRTKPDGTVDIPDYDHTDANVLPGLATLTPEDPLAGLRELAQQVRKAGITSVNDVLIDDRLWASFRVDDVPVSPIVVNDNLLDFSILPGPKPGDLAQCLYRPGELKPTDIINSTASSVADEGIDDGRELIKLKTDGGVDSAGNLQLELQGKVPAGWKTPPIVYTYQFPDPAARARDYFMLLLSMAGVQVAKPNTATLPSREVVSSLPRVATFTPPKFSETAKLINKVSHNLGANMLPMLMAVYAGIESPTLESGMKLIRDFATRAGLDPKQFNLVDGQGLPDNTVSPAAQVQLLEWLRDRPYYDVFKQSMPILGVDGSLKDALPRDNLARGHVRAKTGTLVTQSTAGLVLQTKALAGYMTGFKPTDRNLAFAIYLNDWPINASTGVEDVLAANRRLGLIAARLWVNHCYTP
jgi:D-alanyl-D-alanine carboxypeptidase/D-alanyl-D-alanine-endopeptidase (penicillin-binding protein 4)